MRLARIVALLTSLTVAACGGGGGGGDPGSSGTCVRATPRALDFTAVQGGASPAPQRIGVSLVVTKPSIYRHYWLDSDPGWGSISLVDLATTYDLQVAITRTDQPPGTYVATVRVELLDYSSQEACGYQDVRVTYVVSAGP